MIIHASFVSLYSESSIEPLYFVQITRKGVAEKDISDPCGHFVAKRERYFQGLYLKLVRSRNAKIKGFYTLLTTRIVITPVIYDTYVDLNDDLELDIYVCNMLIRKTSC